MRRLLLVIVTTLAGVMAGAPPAAIAAPASTVTGSRAGAGEPDIEVVASWNGSALDAVRATRASDADAARLYAMVNAAIYDAVNGISGRRAPALVAGHGPRHASPQAAAAAAAHAVLTRADAPRAAGYDARLAADLARLRQAAPDSAGLAPSRPGPSGVDHTRRQQDQALPADGVDSGAAWGAHVGATVFELRADDGSAPVQTQAAGTGPGVFRAAWSGVQYRNVRPFAVADPGRHVPGGPPAIDSARYAAAFAEVARLGDATVPGADLLATYQFWSLPAGSDQPPGEWLRIAVTVAEARDLPLADEARLGALITMALADTTVATVATKYTYRHWRPTTAIREADTDGNPATTADPVWSARAASVGSSPEYVSGHSSYSSAGAAVLAGFFCTDRITFSHTTDSAPGGTARTYPGFSAAAAEAGRSRVYGGLHFDFSNRAGLALGRDVAREVLSTSLLPRSGGHPCPA